VGASCSPAPVCGGSVSGTWGVTSSCLTVSGKLDLSLLGLGCSSAPITGSYEVSGSITFASARYSDNTSTHGIERFHLQPACLTVSGVVVKCEQLGRLFEVLFAPADCAGDASGGCDCTATIAQNGGLGLVTPDHSSSGYYSTSAGTLTLDDSAEYGFCAAQDTLSLRPASKSPTLTGNIVFQRMGG